MKTNRTNNVNDPNNNTDKSMWMILGIVVAILLVVGLGYLYLGNSNMQNDATNTTVMRDNTAGSETTTGTGTRVVPSSTGTSAPASTAP